MAFTITPNPVAWTYSQFSVTVSITASGADIGRSYDITAFWDSGTSPYLVSGFINDPTGPYFGTSTGRNWTIGTLAYPEVFCDGAVYYVSNSDGSVTPILAVPRTFHIQIRDHFDPTLVLADCPVTQAITPRDVWSVSPPSIIMPPPWDYQTVTVIQTGGPYTGHTTAVVDDTDHWWLGIVGGGDGGRFLNLAGDSSFQVQTFAGLLTGSRVGHIQVGCQTVTVTQTASGTGVPAASVKNLCADLFRNQSLDGGNDSLILAWIEDSSGAVKVATHLNPRGYIGSGTGGWSTPVDLESSATDNVGVVFLPNGRVYVTYRHSSLVGQVSDQLGSGDLASWTKLGEGGQSLFSAVGRGQHHAFAFQVAGLLNGSGSIQFVQCGDREGKVWDTSALAYAGSAVGSVCGGCFLGNGYGLLYSRFSDQHVYWKFTANPKAWPAGDGVDTTLIGSVASLTRLSSGLMVGLLWNDSNHKFRTIRSYNGGDDWEVDGSDMTALPAMTKMPMLVNDGGLVYAVYLDATPLPNFATSQDGGLTWS